MSSARDQILGDIRASLGANIDDMRQSTVRDRLAKKERGTIPKRAQLKKPQQVALFCEMAINAHASVDRAQSYVDIPQLVSEYLRNNNLPSALKIGHDRRLSTAKWDQQSQLCVTKGPSDGHDLVGVSHAVAGIAETGTLLLTSGKDNPTTLNFLPDHHIIVLAAKDVVGDMETALAKMAKGQEPSAPIIMPRAVNLITGPSRSGDIEQKLILGAHGPRALKIIIVG